MKLNPEQIPEGFKETEIGLLPEDWEVVKLGEIADIKYGKQTPKEIGVIPVIGSGGIFSMTNKSLTAFPTIIIGRKGTAGKVWLSKNPCYPSDTTFYLNWKKNIDIDFLFNYMTLKPLSGEHAKTTLPSLQKPQLENMFSPFPPLPEQQKIASVLSAVQEAKEKTENVISALKELKKSMMKHLFTYGAVSIEEAEQAIIASDAVIPAKAGIQRKTEKDWIPCQARNDKKLRLKETEIGMIPEHWEVVKLGEVVIKQKGLQRGPWGGSIKKDIFVPVGYRVYEQGNVINNNFDTGRYFIGEDKFKELIDFEVKSEDILITAAGTLGKLAIVPSNIQRGIINQALLRVRLDTTKINKIYFKYLFNNIVDKGVIEGYSHGATLKNLDLPPISWTQS